MIFLRLPPVLMLCLLALGIAARPLRAEFALHDGDRVVLLGSTTIEREPLYGYWETMLVSHFPQANIVFRNLGLADDTVWGEARTGGGTPEDDFQARIEHVAALKPTVIFFAYGSRESSAGEAGLERFTDGLKRLLDRLAATRARIIVLAPLRLERLPPPAPDPAAQNKRLWHYVEALHDLAITREYLFLDLERWLAPVRQAAATPFWTDDGVRLNQLGYWITSAALENDLQLRPSGWKLALDADGRTVDQSGAKLDGLQRTAEKLAFRLESTSLPLTAPVRSPGHTGQLTLNGLKPGRYVLTIDGRRVAEASSDAWEQGVGLDCPAELEQLEALRRTIIKKNELYAHDRQPQTPAEVARIARLVAQQEAEIARLRVPLVHRYELLRQPERR
ncbi:MAG TPA: GDSL-type esterase/lipase family protein [Pirellulales bacterium]